MSGRIGVKLIIFVITFIEESANSMTTNFKFVSLTEYKRQNNLLFKVSYLKVKQKLLVIYYPDIIKK